MKRVYRITFLTVAAVIICVVAAHQFLLKEDAQKTIKVGFLYVGDATTTYTNNFIKAQKAVENEYGDRVEVIAKYNIAEGTEEKPLQELVDAGCELIFSTSYNYGVTTKEFAERYPDVQFCMATCANANEEPKLANYHTFMGEIYQGRYVSGVAAGLKLQELIENGTITKEQAKIGYVAAYPYPEVISGYTAFLLGVRSVVEDAVMSVRYTNKWNDYLQEKKFAREFIKEGCVIISQHSDTAGPAAACEETAAGTPVYLISYNQSMTDVAPTTYLTGCKINWQPYIMGAVAAVLNDKTIEQSIRGNVNGNDLGAGFEETGWKCSNSMNSPVPQAHQEKLREVIEQLEKGKIEVFQGDYTGTDPDNPQDVCDLRKAYKENDKSSAPTFHYVLDDVITVE